MQTLDDRQRTPLLLGELVQADPPRIALVLKNEGGYELEGALVPVHIDVERQCGRYEEPNVWVAYGVGRA